MQPEISEKAQAIKQAAPKNPVKDWDNVAARLVLKELAPKGFSVIKTGPFKGRKKANIEFLSDQHVGNCQTIAAQLIRAFRQKSKNDLDNQLIKAKEQFIGLKFYEFRKRWIYKGIIQALEGSKNSLDKVDIK